MCAIQCTHLIFSSSLSSVSTQDHNSQSTFKVYSTCCTKYNNNYIPIVAIYFSETCSHGKGACPKSLWRN